MNNRRSDSRVLCFRDSGDVYTMDRLPGQLAVHSTIYCGRVHTQSTVWLVCSVRYRHIQAVDSGQRCAHKQSNAVYTNNENTFF